MSFYKIGIQCESRQESNAIKHQSAYSEELSSGEEEIKEFWMRSVWRKHGCFIFFVDESMVVI
jgi:hypothetical protein